MEKEYIDFKVTLCWHKPFNSDTSDPGKISAEFECGDCTPPFKASSTPKDISGIKSNISVASGGTKFSEIIREGTSIANVILPEENNIRQTFRDLWRAGKKIRLRLTYPDETFADDEVERNKQIEQIMRIRWENICLPEKRGEVPCLQHCLSTRPEVSIVHDLRQAQGDDLRSVQVDQVPAKMTYLSRLETVDPSLSDIAKNDDTRIFGEFKNRMENVEEFFDIPSFNEDPATIDAKEAFQTDEFVHLIMHGDINGIKIDDNDVLDRVEILLPFETVKDPKVRAVILLSCNSASMVPDGGLNISAVLHRDAGVPIVIGTTGAIPIPSAEKFVNGFYKALGENPNISLEEAVSMGRDSILNLDLNPSSTPHKDMKWDASFSLPRLFLNGPNSVLVPIKTLFGPDYRLDFDEIIKRENKLRPSDYDPSGGNWSKVINWLRKPERLWFLVTAPTGRGKSTQLTWLLSWLKENSRNDLTDFKIIYHFCQKENPKSVQPLDFVYNSLVPQLIDHYGEPYTNLLRERIRNGRNPRLESKRDVALTEFVIEPLLALKANGIIQPDNEPIIMIDGIDSIPTNRDLDNTILGLLAGASGRLDQVARILVTAEGDLVGSLDNQNRTREIQDRVFHLTNHAKDRKSDLEVEEVATSTFFERVHENLNEPDYKLADWSDLYSVLNRKAETLKDQHGEIVIRLLDVTAVAHEPLHAKDAAMIAHFADNTNDAIVVERLPSLLNDIQPFYKNLELSQQKLIFYHGRFQQYWLQKHQKRVALTHDLFVKAFQPRQGDDWAKIIDWSTAVETKWWKVYEAQHEKVISLYDMAAMANYAKHYLTDHAYHSYITTAPKESEARARRKEALLNLICDPGYRTVRYYEVGSRNSIQDLYRGLEVIYREHVSNFPEECNNKETRLAFNRLFAARQLESSCGKELIKLEASLRRGQADKSALEAFLF